MASFSHKDGRLVMTPQPGAPTKRQLQPFVFKSVIKVSFDPGGKSSYGKGFDQVPYAILTGSAEPKLEIELSDAAEGWDARVWAGGVGAQPLLFSHVFARLGIPPQNFMFKGCSWENGGGYDSDDGAGVVTKISLKLLDAWHQGKSIYT
jgi:hypothetical protein